MEGINLCSQLPNWVFIGNIADHQCGPPVILDHWGNNLERIYLRQDPIVIESIEFKWPIRSISPIVLSCMQNMIMLMIVGASKTFIITIFEGRLYCDIIGAVTNLAELFSILPTIMNALFLYFG